MGWWPLAICSGGCMAREASLKHCGRRVADRLTNLPITSPAVPLEIEGIDRVVAAGTAIGYALEKASGQIRGHARVSSQIAGIIAESDNEKDRLAALKIGCLVVFNAVAFQERLSAVDERVPTVQEALAGGINGLGDAWKHIRDTIDYVPVFELATQVLTVLETAPEAIYSSALKALVRAMEETRDLAGHDLSGRLFHTLLTDAKFTGAYYTSVPAATMLARLVFHNWPPNVDWTDHEFPSSLDIADLACGTGTLLMAVASEAQRRHEEAGGQQSAELHKAMVEQALHGYDVQLSAIHFAATSLAMLNPEIEFDRMRLWVMPHGVEGDQVSLGSLEFLASEEAPVQHALSPEALGIEEQGAERVAGAGLRRNVQEGVRSPGSPTSISQS